MKIIVVGNGKVGYAIARQMAGENHDVTIVDSEMGALQRADSTLDVMCVEGNGASISVLVSAGARTADLVIAVTNLDETNLVCCLIAKKLGARHTVARVRNPDYRRDAGLLKKEIGLDLVINPDLAAAEEIARILTFPAAFSVEPFARGRIDMIGFQVSAEDKIVGTPLHRLMSQRPAEALLCAAERDGSYLIPRGGFTPRAGDRVYMVGEKEELLKMLRFMGRQEERVRTVSLLGGSRIAMYLTWALKASGISIRIVEKDHEKCQYLSAQLPKAMIIEGDGTDNELLANEDILGADAFVSLTNRDEENLLMAINALRSGVGKVLAKMTHPNYMKLVKESGIESIISPKDIVAGQITRYVRGLANSEGSRVESLYRMFGGAVEALEFTVSPAAAALIGVPLKDVPLREGVLLAAIARDEEILIPRGMTALQEGDRVVLVTTVEGVDDLTDILAK